MRQPVGRSVRGFWRLVAFLGLPLACVFHAGCSGSSTEISQKEPAADEQREASPDADDSPEGQFARLAENLRQKLPAALAADLEGAELIGGSLKVRKPGKLQFAFFDGEFGTVLWACRYRFDSTDNRWRFRSVGSLPMAFQMGGRESANREFFRNPWASLTTDLSDPEEDGSRVAVLLKSCELAATAGEFKIEPPPENDSDGSAARASSKGVDTSFLTDDLAAAVVIRPRQIVTSPLVAPFMHEYFFRQMKSGIGTALDVREVEQVMLAYADAGLPDEFLDGAIGVVRLAESIEKTELLNRLCPEGYDTVVWDERTYYRDKDTFGDFGILLDGTISVYLPDDRTIVLAEEFRLRRVLALTPGTSPLIERLRLIGPEQDYAAVVVFDDLPRLKRGFYRDFPRQIPPPWGPLLEIPKSAKAATLTVSLSSDPAVRLELEALEDDQTARLGVLLGSVETMLADACRAGVSLLRGELPGEEVAPLVTLLETLPESFQIATHLDRTIAELRRLASLDAFPDKTGSLAKIAQAWAEDMDHAMRLYGIGIGARYYRGTNWGFPVSYTTDDDGKPLLSWRVAFVRMMADDVIYESLHLDEPWDSDHNIKAAKIKIELFATPGAKPGMTSLMAVVGPGTAWDERARIGDWSMADGRGTTILFVEAGLDKAVPWTKPGDLPFVPDDPISALGNIPDDGFWVVFCDGGVLKLPKDIPKEILKGLFTADGGEEVWEYLKQLPRRPYPRTYL
ncbi:MAG: hypothetical protein HQ581_24715 [Planctomycetes bacterium]|nr:hypothetical protein [Planctomycetota bacterium]